MTAREWQPGDVAAGPWPEHAAEGEVTFSERRIVRFDGLSAGWARADDPDDYLLDSHDWSPTNIARPLAVIDPEDRAAVERLRDLMDAAWNSQNSDHGFIDIAVAKGARGNAMQAALREFANPTPPRPEEPTGLGAVVEDADGKRWVRVLKAPAFAPWAPEGQIGLHSYWRTYADIAAVRMLSEGVTA